MNKNTFSMKYLYGGAKDIGRKRESNQDEIILCPELNLFGVSDGMGGLSFGELASHYVQEALPLLLENLIEDENEPLTVETASVLFREAAVCLSDKLYEEMNQNGVVMGATLAALWLIGNQALILHLGDSRVYCLREGQAEPEQLTEDMNLAGLMVREGLMTRREARNSPASSKLTAFVGMPLPASPKVTVREVQKGDIFLLCSDGLYGMLEDAELSALLRSSENPDQVCTSLIDGANRAGGRDNISAVYLKIQD